MHVQMACPEINQMREEVCQSMKGTVDTWQYKLQARYGDPRVYEMEREAMLREEAGVMYEQNRRNTSLLNDAYTKQSEKQRSTHSTRMTDLKRRGYRTADKPPQSRGEPAPRTAAPPPQPPPEQP
jgi:hypothetical protein